MNGFYITVSNGLLKNGHRKKMGESVWEFMWCLDKMTKIDDQGIGWVLGGKPIKLIEIAKSLEVHVNTISRNLIKLEKLGYLRLIHAPYGISIRVLKAKKRFNKDSEPVDKRFNTNGEPRHGNGEPNKIVSVDNTVVSELRSQKFKKPMKKNTLGRYNENMSSDSYEEEIDADTGQTITSIKTNASEVMKSLITWAENQRGGKFINYPKQYKAMALIRKSNINPGQVKARYKEMENDKFWKVAGFDFMDIYKSFDKKPPQ